MQRAVKILRRLQAARGEYLSAALLSASLFLILAGYYLLKTVREALILAEGGAEVKSYAAAAQSLALILILPAFSWVANRMRGIRLVTGVYLFFALNLVALYALRRAGVSLAVEYYLWLGIFSVISLALFWSYSNDLFTEAQGARLFPYIGVGASVGGFAGARLAKHLSTTLDAHTTMLVGAALITAAAGMLALAGHFAVPPVARVKDDTTLDPDGGFSLIASSRYLILIALMVVLTNIVNSTGEYIVGKTVVAASKMQPLAMQKQFISGFYADYYMAVGLAGIAIQALAVAPVFRKLGVGGALMILPAVALGGYCAVASLPLMWVIQAAKVTENSIDYSLNNTAKHALFLRTSEAVKYKAKTTIDSFFFRFGDVLQAGVVLVGSRFAFSVADYARMNIAVSLVWLCVAGAAAWEYRRQPAPAVAGAPVHTIRRALTEARAAA
jgi:ATP:ADP antiporter, AAA family